MVRIPENKRFFRIGEASKIVGVDPSVLRFWESEFSQIKPQRADSNQRTYQRKDLETLVKIKKLLYEDKLTIEGAKKQLDFRNNQKIDSLFLKSLNTELHEILKLLSS